MKYKKPALTGVQHLEILRARGLIVTDDSEALRYLEHIGYYRLSAYTLPFEIPSDGNSRRHEFVPGTTFDDILRLYLFDRRLRLLVLDAIERIEVSARTAWADVFSLAFTSHGFMDSNHFKDPLEHAANLVKVGREVTQSKESFVVHYFKKYGEPPLPPIWAIVETMSFGSFSHWFCNTASTDVKKSVMRIHGMPSIEVFEGILHALTPIRNICAHHGRLWNRRLTIRLPYFKKLKDRLVPPNDATHRDLHLHNYLVIIDYLMERVNPDSRWNCRLFAQLLELTESERGAMGFPVDWRNRDPWRTIGIKGTENSSAPE